MPKPIFRTEKGSLYFLNEDGTWSRHKYNGKVIDDFFYVGSIDSSQNPVIFPPSCPGFYDKRRLWKQLFDGQIPGFEPEFKIGLVPMGICGCKPNEIVYSGGRLMYFHPLKIGLHVGDKITEVFESELAKVSGE